jgi:hypothetical protein
VRINRQNLYTIDAIRAFYPENYSVNARCLDDYDPDTMGPRRLFDGKHWEAAFTARGREWEAKR